MSIRFIFPGIPKSQNELDGKHWRVKHAEKTYWHQVVSLIAKQGPRNGRSAVVTILRVSPRLIDPLNCYAGCKWLVDCLVSLGWLRGDAYGDVTFNVDQRKTTKGEEPHTEVEILYH